MEDVSKNPEEAEPPVKTPSGVFKPNNDPTVEINGASKSLLPDGKVTAKYFQNLFDANESKLRAEMEEVRRRRFEHLEAVILSGKEEWEAATREWKQKETPQELQQALSSQLELCDTIIEQKEKRINDQKQALKAADDRYLKDMRRQAEELDLIIERTDNKISTLKSIYREELAQIERIYWQECEVLLTKDKAEWEPCMKTFLDREMEMLRESEAKILECGAKFHSGKKMINSRSSLIKNKKLNAAKQKERAMVKDMHDDEEDMYRARKLSLANSKARLASLGKTLKKIHSEYKGQGKHLTKRKTDLAVEYKRLTQRYEDTQNRVRLAAGVDARRFKDMWLMLEEEAKQLVERILVIDSRISKQYLGLAWERPTMPFMERPSLVQPKKKSASCSNDKMVDAPGGPKLQSENSPDAEDGTFPLETVKEVMDLLCDEAGLLIHDYMMKLLPTLDKKDQTSVKLISLLHSLEIQEEDFPKLVYFLMKYKHQQPARTEDVFDEPGESSDKAEKVETNSGHVDPNHLVFAVRSFLKQLIRSRESSAQPCFQEVEVRDPSKDKAYWESVGNIVSERKLQVWEAAGKALKQHHGVLSEVSELESQIRHLEKQNKELRRLLPPDSGVQECVEGAKPVLEG